MKRLTTFVGILLAAFAGVALPAQASTDIHYQPITLAQAAAKHASGQVSVAACDIVTIISNANGRYVTMEANRGGQDNGMLRARATAQGAWEWYEVCFSGTSFTLRSLQNNRYVTAEISRPGDNNGMLRARATAVGPWEWFTFSPAACPDCYTMRSQANGRYVTAELGRPEPNYGMLRARASVAGEWERFR